MKVSAIVCAYNEAKTIGPIIKTLANHPAILETIIVDDGSTDSTGKIISRMNLQNTQLIKHAKNLGKGAAVISAVKKSIGDTLLFVDADLLHFHSAHIDLMLCPLLINNRLMVIGVPEQGSPLEKNYSILLKSLSGVRAVGKNLLLKTAAKIKNSGYGVETIINLYHQRLGGKTVYIPLPELIHKAKTEKHPFYKYISEYIKENADVIKQYLEPENKVPELFLKKLANRLGLT